MPDPPRRRFTLADGMILVAASAAAAWLSRWQGKLPPRLNPGGRFSTLPYFHAAQPWLASWILGLLGCAVLSLCRSPRMPAGVRYRRPDWLGVSFLVLCWTYVATVCALIY